jgi:hypothetical protein
MSDGGLAGFLVFSSKNMQKAEGASRCRALLVERISMLVCTPLRSAPGGNQPLYEVSHAFPDESIPVLPSSYLLGQGAGLNTEVSLPLIISVTANSLGGSVHENSTGIGRICDEAVG